MRGGGPPEGLFRNGDGRRDGPLVAESWQLPCKSRDTCKNCNRACSTLRVKKLKYVDDMTTAGVHVTLLISGLQLDVLLEGSCMELFE